jgi:hypothetical protein
MDSVLGVSVKLSNIAPGNIVTTLNPGYMLLK